MIQDRALTSNVITALRFPLMLGVVLIHCRMKGGDISVFEGIQNILSVHFPSPCVPLFFFFSGYLFFLNTEERFTMGDYVGKLKKRTRSIFIPYIFWNAVVLGYFAFMHKFTPSLINPENCNVYQYSALDLIRSFWDYPGGQPICYQFWFLRDLIIGFVFSPLFYYVIKYTKWYIVAILLILYIYSEQLFPHQTMITFISLGICFSIHQYDFVRISMKFGRIFLITFIMCLIYSLLYVPFYGRGLETISGMIVFLWAATVFVSAGYKSTSFLVNSSFFVYAFHGFPI
ncbi:MAG: acyltransferase, partial [Anaeroplasmataceae bacterium]|nr:acyltransferase [Anaeroplasmataceae bacterium]